MSGGSELGADERIVRCPGCGERTIYGPRNRFRPFCSARCKGQDFGAWASEHFRVPDQMPHEDELFDDPPPPSLQ